MRENRSRAGLVANAKLPLLSTTIVVTGTASNTASRRRAWRVGVVTGSGTLSCPESGTWLRECGCDILRKMRKRRLAGVK